MTDTGSGATTGTGTGAGTNTGTCWGTGDTGTGTSAGDTDTNADAGRGTDTVAEPDPDGPIGWGEGPTVGQGGPEVTVTSVEYRQSNTFQVFSGVFFRWDRVKSLDENVTQTGGLGGKKKTNENAEAYVRTGRTENFSSEFELTFRIEYGL